MKTLKCFNCYWECYFKRIALKWKFNKNEKPKFEGNASIFMDGYESAEILIIS